MNEIDRLIAMLEPGASENTVLFVRNELRSLIRSTWSNDYVPQKNLNDKVLPEAIDAEINVENDWSSTSQGERTEQQMIDLYDVRANDPIDW
jgi:hypothetical protein